MTTVHCRPIGTTAGAILAVLAIMLAAPAGAETPATPQATSRALPSFLDTSRLPDLMAAREAIVARHKAAVAASRATKEAEIRLLAASDELNRRAEAERVLAADIRLRAEALSQKFAAEVAPAEPAVAAVSPLSRPHVAKVASAPPPAPDQAAAAVQRASDALSRASRDLEEITRRAEAAKAQSKTAGAWTTVVKEIDEARRQATEAVAQALKALDEKQRALLQPGEAPVVTASGDTAAPEKKADRMVPPYALGGAVR